MRFHLNVAVTFLAVVGLYCAPAQAQISKAYFSGYTFMADQVEIGVRFPYSLQISEEKDAKGIGILDAELGKRLMADLPTSFDLDFGTSDATGEVTLAFALDWENVSVTKIGDVYKIVIDIHAQILAFDFAEKKVIAAFPVAVQLRDGAKEKPSKTYIMSRIRELYLTNKHGVNVFDEFIARFKTVKINAKYRNYIQLTDVDVTGRAMKKVSEFSQLKLSNFKGFVGQHFTKFLSVNQSVAVLPYSKGQAIGGRMAMRFSDGEVFDMTMPEPNYQMQIQYTGFGKKLLDKNNVWEAWLYVTGYTLPVLEPLSGRKYLSAGFRDSVVVKQVAGETEPDHWSAYQGAFFSLSTNLTKQISLRDTAWLDKRTKEKNVSEQLEKLEGILERCR